MNSQTDAGRVRRTLLGELERFALKEGANQSAWPGLSIFRADDRAARIPVVYDPCICFVGHGRKRVHLAGRDYTYDPLHYLVVGVPLPVEAEIIDAGADSPFLSLRLDVDVPVLSELLMDAKHVSEPDEAPRAIYASPMNANLSDAVIRLLKSLHDENDARVLAPLAVREVLYHILAGEQGERLRAVALRDSRAHRINAVLRYMRDNYRRPLNVDELARQAHMSTSTFHHNFKSVTSISPLQYLKKIRLHQARFLMLHDGANAGEAADAVGYNSPSQFTREFKRLFGTPPTQEVKRLRNDRESSGEAPSEGFHA